MKERDRYLKIVEWSEEDQCYIGSVPGWIGKCCHGNDEENVYRKLCQIVDEWIEIYAEDGRTLGQLQIQGERTRAGVQRPEVPAVGDPDVHGELAALTRAEGRGQDLGLNRDGGVGREGGRRGPRG